LSDELGRDLLRLAEVVATLAGRLAGPAARALVAPARRRATARRLFYRRLVDVLEQLGPAYVKAGQIVGTRRDIVPQALCDALERLSDSVAPLSAEQSRHHLARIYGQDLDELFRDVDLDPVASGSVACVYRAVDATGRCVALKMLRPGAAVLVERDLRLALGVARLLAAAPPLARVPVEAMVAELGATVRAQLDLDRERASLDRLREDLLTAPRVWIPRTVPELCRSEVLAMEFIAGLEQGAADSMTVATRRRLAASTLDVIYQMLFLRGFVHCDLHPGNLYFLRSGHVVVLDAGFSVQLSDRLRRLFAEFFLNMSIGRGEKCAELVLLSAAAVPPDLDVEAFTADLSALVTRVHGLTAVQFSLVDFAVSMFAIQRRHGVRAAPELLFPLLSLMVVEGTVRDLDPEIDFQERARPHLVRGRFGVASSGA
jgi:ubiquinone biosynthesis protein